MSPGADLSHHLRIVTRSGAAALGPAPRSALFGHREPAEREFIAAMASVGDDTVRRADIARVLGVSSESLSVHRARLIDKGFLQSSGRGSLEFTIPGFAEFIRDLERE